MTDIKPRTLFRIALYPNASQSATLASWWRSTVALDIYTAQLTYSYIQRSPIETVTGLLETLDSPLYLEPNAPVLGHRILGAGRLPAKSQFSALLRQVAERLGMSALPYGLIDGLTHRWYETIATGDTLTCGDLPTIRSVYSPLEIFSTGFRVLDDQTLSLRIPDGTLEFPAEIFTLPAPVFQALQRGDARISEGVFQATNNGWSLWLSISNLPDPEPWVPTSLVVGLDPGIRRWLVACDDRGAVRLPLVKPADTSTLDARKNAYLSQQDEIAEVIRILRTYRHIGIEAASAGEMVVALHDCIKRGFLRSVLDQVASAALRREQRQVVQTPSQFSSRVDATGAWLPSSAYQPGRLVDCGGMQIDRDDLAAQNLCTRLQQFADLCPQWWQHLPRELTYFLGDKPRTLVKRPHHHAATKTPGFL